MILFASRASLAGELARFDFSWFIPAIVRYRKLLLEVLGVSLALQVFGLVTPLMFQVVMDKVLVNRTFSTLNVVCMALFICAIFEVLLTGLRNYVFAHTTNRIDVELGARLFRHLVALPLGYFGARRVGDKGVAPVTDALQAQTQYEQAVFALNKAYTDAQKALGTLASDMGFDPTLPVDVPLSSADAPTVRDIAESIDEMIASAKERHPSVRAAQAQYDAAVAKVTQTRAQGLPSISLVGKYSRNDQPQRLGLSMPTYPATGNDAFIGVQISIPLFEGFGRQYQIKQATAQAERQLVSLDGTRRQVALEVWTSYQTLNGATKNAETSASLLAIAERSWVAAQRRYDAGVGNIVELLNTQTALANAKQRRIQTSAEWDDARIDLATKLGRLEWVSVN
ncbi:hypothetical protein NK8_40910 [Caballeronia sp. NK8]|nr:hypothetical protein NK8_40910 [Caballeronia sp. NK8]